MRRLVYVVAVFAAGCINNGHKCYLTGAADIPAQEQRDPESGQCVVTDPGPYCDPGCPCPPTAGPAVDWASCFGPCEGLAESDCVASTSCHAAYQDTGGANPTFWDCFELPPSGAITGACTNLDAQTCSEHIDCVSIYAVNTGATSFERCAAEAVPVACSTLTTEAACKARADCDPVYVGTNCTCDHSGCTCQTETFDHCQSL